MSDALGAWLRRARETQQKDLDDIEKVLRIRRRYLHALEIGDYAALPGEIQARGFLKNYARYLGLPVEDAMARYESEISGRPIQPRMVTYTQPEPERSGLRSWAPPPPSIEQEVAGVRSNTSASLMRIAMALIAIFAFIAIGGLLWLQFGPAPDAAVTPTGDVLAPTADLTPMPDASPTPTLIPEFPVAADGRVRIRLVTESSEWISFSSDEQVVFQGISQAGQVLESDAGNMVLVSTGNGAAFRLYINGTDWGLLGEQGEVIRRAWTPTGEVLMEGN